MRMEIIRKRLEEYECATALERVNALKEIIQEIALMALSRQGFFRQAEFHGGTALRILHGLPRFSEDLDFALLVPNRAFRLEEFLKGIATEFECYGCEIEIQDRFRLGKTVQLAFLKDDSMGKMLFFEYGEKKPKQKIKVKLEVDTNPPLGAHTEVRYLDFPLPFSVQAKDLKSSFAGKLHALLCRSYVKGRDWYDFIWYVSRRVEVNYEFLSNAIYQIGPWAGEGVLVDKEWILDRLTEKMKSVDWLEASREVMHFLRGRELASLEVWGEAFFRSRIEKLGGYLKE